MRYYAIADLHGRLDLLNKAMKAIAKDIKADDLTGGDYLTITLGDYIDRGPDSKGVIDRLRSLQDYDVISLKGNHEDMMVQSIVQHLDPEWWVGNGGGKTLLSYGHPEVKYISDVSYADVPEEHVVWMSALPLYHETEKHVFVHAGIPYSNAALDKQDQEKMIWMLYGPHDHGGWFGNQEVKPRITKHIVHGHHQFANGPHEWEYRTDLDTFAWNTGRLVIGVFDDTQGKALRYIEVLGDDYQGSSEKS